MKILMVCLGNICRSPLAEGILQHKVGDKHLVTSAGTGDWHVGEKPDRRSVEVALRNGVDIADQRAQHFSPLFFDGFDLIYAMDQTNYDDLMKLTQSDDQRKKVKLFLEDAFGEAANVPDPYYGSITDFEAVYDLIDRATDQLLTKYSF